MVALQEEQSRLEVGRLTSQLKDSERDRNLLMVCISEYSNCMTSTFLGVLHQDAVVAPRGGGGTRGVFSPVRGSDPQLLPPHQKEKNGKKQPFLAIFAPSNTHFVPSEPHPLPSS